MIYSTPTNEEIAQNFMHIAKLLKQQNASVYRILAYEKAAAILHKSTESMANLVQAGKSKFLAAIPGIGNSLARQIEEMVNTGKSSLLLRLQGEIHPEDLFEEVPGIGAKLAEKIVRELNIHSLEELELAAHDGRLGIIEGFGAGRIDLIKIYLADLLNPTARKWLLKNIPKLETKPEKERPSVDLLLEMDDEYLEKAAKGELEFIAPRRFNPYNEAWLPIYHSQKDGWEMTALFSNTARAHELEKTDDWVVIFFEKEHLSDQVTVVTETKGPLKGKRVVRGKEVDCGAFYQIKKADLKPTNSPFITPLT